MWPDWFPRQPVPQQGTLDIQTEFGYLEVKSGEIAVIQRVPTLPHRGAPSRGFHSVSTYSSFVRRSFAVCVPCAVVRVRWCVCRASGSVWRCRTDLRVATSPRSLMGTLRSPTSGPSVIPCFPPAAAFTPPRAGPLTHTRAHADTRALQAPTAWPTPGTSSPPWPPTRTRTIASTPSSTNSMAPFGPAPR